MSPLDRWWVRTNAAGTDHSFGFVKEDDMLVGNFGDGRINVFSPSGQRAN